MNNDFMKQIEKGISEQLKKDLPKQISIDITNEVNKDIETQKKEFELMKKDFFRTVGDLIKGSIKNSSDFELWQLQDSLSKMSWKYPSMNTMEMKLFRHDIGTEIQCHYARKAHEKSQIEKGEKQ